MSLWRIFTHWFAHLWGWQMCRELTMQAPNGDTMMSHECIVCGEQAPWWNLSEAMRKPPEYRYQKWVLEELRKQKTRGVR